MGGQPSRLTITLRVIRPLTCGGRSDVQPHRTIGARRPRKWSCSPCSLTRLRPVHAIPGSVRMSEPRHSGAFRRHAKGRPAQTAGRPCVALGGCATHGTSAGTSDPCRRLPAPELPPGKPTTSRLGVGPQVMPHISRYLQGKRPKFIPKADARCRRHWKRRHIISPRDDSPCMHGKARGEGWAGGQPTNPPLSNGPESMQVAAAIRNRRRRPPHTDSAVAR